jgi:hypothetical protein
MTCNLTTAKAVISHDRRKISKINIIFPVPDLYILFQLIILILSRSEMSIF